MASILVIEDTVENWQLLELLITKAGHRAVHAVDGASGLAKLREAPFDLVLVDIYMPGMDGYELIRQVREDEQLQAGRYIAVTALAMDGDRDQILSAGFDEYIAKPIDVEQVFARFCALNGGETPA